MPNQLEDFSQAITTDHQQKVIAKVTKVKDTKAEEAKQKFFSDGHTIPPCVNAGCKSTVTVREWKNWSFKTECGHCSIARKNERYIFEDGVRWIVNKKGQNEGIIIHKEMFCENHDGHLGFVCPVPKDQWIYFQSGLDLDHINSNHYDNSPENVETICKLCHNRKSIESGDCNSNKSSARKIE
jgi:hypothetical protein